MIWIAIPVMNPSMTAFDMKLVIQPSRARPATRNTAPAAIASAAVKVTAAAVLLGSRPATTVAEIAATEPAAENTSSLEPPKSA